jgi:hypothetical protein
MRRNCVKGSDLRCTETGLNDSAICIKDFSPIANPGDPRIANDAMSFGEIGKVGWGVSKLRTLKFKYAAV